MREKEREREREKREREKERGRVVVSSSKFANQIQSLNTI